MTNPNEISNIIRKQIEDYSTDLNIDKATGRIAQIPVGDGLLGRVLDPLAIPIDGKGEAQVSESRLIESMAPGIISRKSVCEPLQTGITAIKLLLLHKLLLTYKKEKR